MVKCHVIHVNPLSVSSLSDLNMTEGQRSTKKILLLQIRGILSIIPPRADVYCYLN